jgi:hypothetical protein
VGKITLQATADQPLGLDQIRLFCYFAAMSDAHTLSHVMPSATPTEAELEAWRNLPRDEQLQRMRNALAHPEASEEVTDTMADILLQARAAAGLPRG